VKRKIILVASILSMIIIAVTGCSTEKKEELNVLNYDIYIDKKKS